MLTSPLTIEFQRRQLSLRPQNLVSKPHRFHVEGASVNSSASARFVGARLGALIVEDDPFT